MNKSNSSAAVTSSKEGSKAVVKTTNTTKTSKQKAEVSLSDLPDVEKEKVARLAQRLITLGRDHEKSTTKIGELTKENLSLQTQHQESSTLINDLNQKLSTAYGLVQLYQTKLSQVLGVLEASEKKSDALQSKHSALEAELSRQDELVKSQRQSIECAKVQSTLHSSFCDEQIQRLETDNKHLQALQLERNDSIDAWKKKLSQSEANLILKESAIVTLETQLMRLQNEVDVKSKEHRQEKHELNTIIQKTLEELEYIKSAVPCYDQTSRATAMTQSSSTVPLVSTVDVCWEDAEEVEVKEPATVKEKKVYPLLKPRVPHVAKKSKKLRFASTTGATKAPSEALDPITVEPPQKPTDKGKAEVLVGGPKRLETPRNENVVNGTVAVLGSGGAVRDNQTVMYDARLFHLLREIG